MRNYDRINVRPPEGIERKRAHILGGGIAGLAAAAFLVDEVKAFTGKQLTQDTMRTLVDGADGHDPSSARAETVSSLVRTAAVTS